MKLFDHSFYPKQYLEKKDKKKNKNIRNESIVSYTEKEFISTNYTLK